jgi:hypothetical protein
MREGYDFGPRVSDRRVRLDAHGLSAAYAEMNVDLLLFFQRHPVAKDAVPILDFFSAYCPLLAECQIRFALFARCGASFGIERKAFDAGGGSQAASEIVHRENRTVLPNQ